MASVHKRKLAPGDKKTKPYYVRFADPTRPRPDGTPKQGSKSFRTSKEADAYKRKVETELEAGNFVAAPRSVRELCEAFREWNAGRLSDGMIGRARVAFLEGSVRNKILPRLGAYKLTDVTPAMLLAWYRGMVRDDEVQPLTAKRHVKILGLAYDLARRRGWFKGDLPTTEALKDLRGLPSKKVRTFTPEDMRRIIEVLQHRRPRQKVRSYAMSRSIVLLGAICGLRFGEIMGLKLGAIDFGRSLIRVQHNLTAWGELKDTKTAAGMREVPMPSIVAAELSAWLEADRIVDADALLFRTPKGTAVTNTNFRTSVWYPLLKDAGLADGKGKYRFHSTRHFAASWMVDNGWTLPEVQKVMGHATFDMTLSTYAHPLQSDARRVENAERISQLLRPTPLLLSQGVRMRPSRAKQANLSI